MNSDPYFPPPVASDAAKATNAAFNQCWVDGNACTTAGSYATNDIKYDAGSGKVALPGGWLSWDNANQKLVIAPTLVSQALSYPIYATYTSTSGTPTEFQVATVNVDRVVTAYTMPSAPAGNALSYTLWSAPKAFDFTQTWVQSPACGHAYTDSFTWTGLNTYVVQDANSPGRVVVSATALAAVGTHAVTVANSPTVTANSKYAGGASTPFAAGNDKVSFTITIVNPCTSTTLNTITVSGTTSSNPYSKTVIDGATGAVTFVRPTTTAEDTNKITAVCGATTYTIHKDNQGGSFTFSAAWAVISGPAANGQYTLTIDTTKDTNLIATEATVTHNLFIRARLDDYNSVESYTAVDIVVSAATCSCNALAWAAPSSGVDITAQVINAGLSEVDKVMAKPDPDAAARATDPTFDKCYIGNSPPGCSGDGQITAITW